MALTQQKLLSHLTIQKWCESVWRAQATPSCRLATSGLHFFFYMLNSPPLPQGRAQEGGSLEEAWLRSYHFHSSFIGQNLVLWLQLTAKGAGKCFLYLGCNSSDIMEFGKKASRACHKYLEECLTWNKCSPNDVLFKSSGRWLARKEKVGGRILSTMAFALVWI